MLLLPLAFAVASNSIAVTATVHDAASAARCEELRSADLSGIQDAPSQITSTKLVPGAGARRGYCRAQGYVSPQVGFEIRLPSSGWNGKLLALGNGGWGGEFDADTCDAYLKRGYACVASDTGHKGRSGDGVWAFHNLQAQVDFGYRSVHVVALAGKGIVEWYYTRPAQHSYFVGCSTGGFEGLVEAQRFPWDFDGILAGAPDMDEADLMMRMVWSRRNFVSKSGEPILSTEDIQLLHRAVLAACDMDDGVKDGIVGNPLACRFDPATLSCNSTPKHKGCLTQTQVDAVRRMYAGPSNSAGEALSTRGVLPGSELVWENVFGGRSGQSLVDFAGTFFKYMVYGASPDWKATDFNFDADYKRIGLGMLYSNTNPDLRKFKSAAGKLIVYQGASDLLEGAGAILDYYTTTERTMGGRAATQDFFRLFLVPGMLHCGAGDGAYSIDYLTYLERWVEKHEAPNVMIGAHVSDSYLASLPVPSKWQSFATTTEHRVIVGGALLEFPLDPAIPVSFTRPVYPYPLYAKYSGVGDPRKAVSFVPARP